jgi:glycosyltransferase involved in cell wall biosynthesis
MKVSIIIVTRNRAEDLVQTLAAMAGIRVPDGLTAELVVVDNGSTDHTAEVVRSARMDKIGVRTVCEEMPGLSHGRNRGLAETTGEIVMFTDDDIRFPENWLVAMTAPVVSGAAEAVCGGVEIAPHLLRPWMTPLHRSWLASSEWLDSSEPQGMVGANMAFSRDVLRKVPGFDAELGAGALGSCEESLFSSQLREAGYQIFNRLDVCVEHHFQPGRLIRSAWLDAAQKQAASRAYCGHHWEHWGCRFGRARLLRAAWNLSRWRSANRRAMEAEGCSEEELALIVHESMIRAHLRESRRPRNYNRHGLRRVR